MPRKGPLSRRLANPQSTRAAAASRDRDARRNLHSPRGTSIARSECSTRSWRRSRITPRLNGCASASPIEPHPRKSAKAGAAGGETTPPEWIAKPEVRRRSRCARGSGGAGSEHRERRRLRRRRGASPARYEIDEVVAIAVDPRTIYLYWEIRPTTLAHARKRTPEGRLAIRIVSVLAGLRRPITRKREINVDALHGDLYVHDIEPGSHVRVAIGWLASSFEEPFAVGIEVAAPQAHYRSKRPVSLPLRDGAPKPTPEATWSVCRRCRQAWQPVLQSPPSDPMRAASRPTAPIYVPRGGPTPPPYGGAHRRASPDTPAHPRRRQRSRLGDGGVRARERASREAAPATSLDWEAAAAARAAAPAKSSAAVPAISAGVSRGRIARIDGRDGRSAATPKRRCSE